MILVTGATGFLGSELVRQLLDGGKKVRALKRPSSVIPRILNGKPSLEWFDADILDYFALEQALEGVTLVYHCAALLSFAAEDKKKQLRINKEGTHHLVNLCLDKGIEKLVHVSSVAALGESKGGTAITEKNQWEFDGSQQGYSISKYESEMEVWRAMAEGLNAVIVNPSIIIGKNAGKKGSGQIFETLSKGVKFYTSGSNGFVDVEDVAGAMIVLMESDVSAERFLLNAENWNLKDIFIEAANAFNLPPPSIEAKPWMMEFGWRGAELLSMLNGKKYGLTKDTARNAFKKSAYSGAKFLERFPDFKYKPIKISIKEVCDALKK
ncbi:MAG: NAD-dependent epimerase/dehydratase family protein [Sphingobacteriaceae bacterium]|nr:NAD-dependent epimerase/dehydratase family protein [Sphingobacteriaceae bacterium]